MLSVSSVAQASRLWMDRFSQVSGMLASMERQHHTGCIALMYHRVLPDALAATYPLANLAVPESVFKAQIEWLARHCIVDTFETLLSNRQDWSTVSPRQRVCITFDDGYWDNRAIAAPILRDNGLRATFFITTDFVAAGRLLWFDLATYVWQYERAIVRQCFQKTCPDAPPPTALEDWLSWLKSDAQVRAAAMAELSDVQLSADAQWLYAPLEVNALCELRDEGHELGAHSKTHPIMTQLDDQTLADEVTGSTQQLATWLNQPVSSFAYPNGNADDRVRSAVVKAGIQFACTTRRGAIRCDDDPLMLNRQPVYPASVTDSLGRHSTLAYRAEIFGLHDRQRRMLSKLKNWRKAK